MSVCLPGTALADPYTNVICFACKQCALGLSESTKCAQKRCPNAGSVLVQRHRRCTSTDPALGISELS